MNYPTFFTLFHSYIFPSSFFLNEKATDVVSVAIVGEMDIFYELNFCSSTTFPLASVARQWVMLRVEDEMQIPHLVSFLPSAS